MKKIFIALVALATIAACDKAQVVEAPQGDAIAFGDAFVDNSTKVIYNKADNIKGFKVWGNVDGTNTTPVALYPNAGADVTRGSAGLGAAWTCSVARYWTPSASYNFVAIANGTGTELANGIPTKISYSINSTDPADLIYGATRAETNEYAVPVEGVNTSNVVTFTMEHLLSRLQVAFQNELSEGYTYDIKNVKVTALKEGVYTINDEEWNTVGQTAEDLVYGELEDLAPTNDATALAAAHLIIPGSEITISFDYDLELNSTVIYSKSVTNQSVPLVSAKGFSYTINVQLQAGNRIEFSVIENDDENSLTWGNGSTQNI